MATSGPARPVGPWRSGWRRLRRDRWGLASLVAVAAIVLLALFGGATTSQLVGHGGVEPFAYAANINRRPVGPWTRVATPATRPVDDYGNLLPPPKDARRTLFVLGAAGPLGRAALIRLLDGLRRSLEVRGRARH